MTKRFRDFESRTAASVKLLEMKRQQGWRTMGRSGSSQTLSRGSGFSLLTRTAHSAGSTALTGKRTDKGRKRSQRGNGEELKTLVALKFQRAHPPCFFKTRSKKGGKRLQLKEISQ